MVVPVVWEATDAVVAVPQDLDPQLVVLLQQQSSVRLLGMLARMLAAPGGTGPVWSQNSEHTHGGQLVEASEELVEQLDQLLGAAGRGQLGEAHDVCEQDTERTTNTHQPAAQTCTHLSARLQEPNQATESRKDEPVVPDKRAA